MTDLRWIRIFDPVHIPLEYVEQIKDRAFDVNKFYKYQSAIAWEETENGAKVLNPNNLLYALVNERNLVKGFCWMVIDPLCDALVINSYSVDKEYWNSGSCVDMLKEKALEIKEGALLKTVYWITRSPRHSEKHGFKRSKHVLMEYRDGSEFQGNTSEADGSSELTDS